MIKKFLIAFLAISFSASLYAQVGINNISPKQILHVSGSGTGLLQPVIRVEGLNSKNNPAHESTASVKRVFSDSNGNLVIGNNDQTNKFYTYTSLPDTKIPGGTERVVISRSFTLDYASIVHIESRVGMSTTNNLSDPSSSAAQLLRNGQARLFGSYYKLTAAPNGVQTNRAFGHVIISHSTNDGGAQLSGQYYIEPRKDLYLPKGTYTVALYGYSQNSDLDFAINLTDAETGLIQPTQQMIISITPVSY